MKKIAFLRTYQKVLFFSLIVFSLAYTDLTTLTNNYNSSEQPNKVIKKIQGSKVLLINDPALFSDIYKYNEVFYLPFSEIVVESSDTEFYNLSSSVEIKTNMENRIRKIEEYRMNSPYFNMCGELDVTKLDCLYEFCDKNEIEYVISKIPLKHKHLINKYPDFDGYFYQVNN